MWLYCLLAWRRCRDFAYDNIENRTSPSGIFRRFCSSSSLTFAVTDRMAFREESQLQLRFFLSSTFRIPVGTPLDAEKVRVEGTKSAKGYQNGDSLYIVLLIGQRRGSVRQSYNYTSPRSV